MKPPRILVAGATGKTGAATVRHLLAAGLPVRAMVHRLDGRSEALRALGVEVVAQDLHDYEGVSKALCDVQRAYFCAPLLRNALAAGTVFAAAAKDRHLELVVALSQWLASPSHPSAHTRETWLADRVFSWLPGVDHVTVNPGWFADNYMAALEPISQFGLMPMPLGQGRNAPPSNEDIAAVVAAILQNPAPHIGRAYRPTGPELLDPHQIAQTFARVLDRPVRYVDAPADMFSKVARALNLPDFTTLQVLSYFEDYKRDAFALGAPSNAVAEIVGRPPESFETIVRRYVGAARAERRTAASVLRAVAGLGRILITPALDPERFGRVNELPSLTNPTLAAHSPQWLQSHANAPRGRETHSAIAGVSA